MAIVKRGKKRTGLGFHLGQQSTFIAEFGTFSMTTDGTMRKTALLLNIKDTTGRVLADHTWIKVPAGFEELKLKAKDIIVLVAEAVEYYQDNWRGKIRAKYTLENLTNISKQELNDMTECG